MKDKGTAKSIKGELIKLAGMTSSRFSISPIAGQIYALLYVSDKPVSLNDMVKELRISKGSASTNIRALEAWGAVRKVWVNSDRKDYYESEADISSIIYRRFREGFGRRLSEVTAMMESIDEKIKSAKNENPAEFKFYKKRFGELKKLVSTAESVLAAMPRKFPGKKLEIIKKFFV